jgi:hypothetical protein
MDEARILETARADILRANAYYDSYIDPILTRRYEVYRSDPDRYARLYPQTHAECSLHTFDLWSMVEWMLPFMLKAFFGSDRIISISGVESEDADRAERVMKLLQWQLTVKNPGYRVFKSWFTDALVTNMGVLKCYWKRETEKRRSRKEVGRAELVGMIQGGVRILASDPIFTMYGEPMSMITYEEDVVTTNQPVIEVVQPSDIRFTPDGRTFPDCSMVAHRKITTVDELKREAARGVYDPDEVNYIAESVSDDDYKATQVEQSQRYDAGDEQDSRLLERGRARVDLYECYLKADINDDGLLEDAIVTVCKDRLLRTVENPYGRAPLFEFVPFWDSYQIWPKVGLAEIIENIQDAHTALLKQSIIGLGLSNQGRCLVDPSGVNWNDLVSGKRYVRLEPNRPAQEVFYPMPAAGLNPQNFQLLEYLQSQMEQWAPMTRYNQGTDGKSLNKTATGVSMIMNASQQRQEEITRNAAETSISDLFRFLIKVNQMYLDQPQVIRLQNDIIQFAPDDIQGDFDLSVDATSGIGARDSKVQVLTSYLREMWPFAAQIGAAGPEQFVFAAQKLLKLMGVEDADKYISMPQMNPMMMMGGIPIGPGGQQGAGVATVTAPGAGGGALPAGAGGAVGVP